MPWQSTIRLRNDLVKCIQIDPKNAAAWTVYGEVLFHARHLPKEAMDKYEKAIALDATRSYSFQ
jgi:Tfp pilus assembly protein PilF